MMLPESTARAVEAKYAAYQGFTEGDITLDFYNELLDEIQRLHTAPEETTLEDLPQDMLEYVRTLNLQETE